MANSFGTQGSMAGNPQSGLLGNMSVYKPPQQSGVLSAPKPAGAGSTLPSNPMGTPSSGIIGSINNATGLGSSQPSNQVGSSSAPNMSVYTPTTPLKKITSPDGSSAEFHSVVSQASKDNSTGSSTPPVTNPTPTVTPPAKAPDDPSNQYNTATGQPNPNWTGAPAYGGAPAGTNANNGTNFAQNVNNINTASNLNSNPEYATLAQQNNELVQEQAGAPTAGIGGTPIAGVGTNNATYQGLFAPQTTASLQGKENEFNTNNSIQMAGNAAEAQRLQQAGQLQTQGAESVAGLTAPQQVSPTSGEYLPGSNTYAQGAGGSAGGGNGSLANVGSLLQSETQGQQVRTMQGIQMQGQALATNLSNLIDQAGINPANASVFTSGLNGINQWLNGQAGDPKYQNFANLITEVASKYSNILNQSGGTPTDVSTVTKNIMNGLASGQDIKTVLASLDKNATDSINALSASANGQTSNGLYDF